jgi:hypothetical protein
VQKQMMKGMGPILSLQFLMTVVTTTVLALFAASRPADWNPYGEAGFFWLGFVVPTQVSAVIFGGDKKQWMLTKILIASGGSFLCLMAAAAVLHNMA